MLAFPDGVIVSINRARLRFKKYYLNTNTKKINLKQYLLVGSEYLNVKYYLPRLKVTFLIIVAIISFCIRNDKINQCFSTFKINEMLI